MSKVDSLKVVQLGHGNPPPDAVHAIFQALSFTDAIVGIYDDHDRLRYANNTFLQAFKILPGEEISFAQIVLRAYEQKSGVHINAADPHAFIADAQLRRRILAKAPRQRSFPTDFVDGEWYWCTETLLPNGWIIISGSNITTLKKTEKHLEEARDRAVLLSHVDELTGVPNRRFAMARLNKLMQRATESRAALCVALLDLDHFKSINDVHGHDAGDRALRHFARHCMSCIRTSDMLGRLGGEEFILLLPKTLPSVAKQIIERILSSLPVLIVDGIDSQQTIRLSFSAGIAQLADHERGEDVVARADAALYRAKTSGRAQVHIGV